METSTTEINMKKLKCIAIIILYPQFFSMKFYHMKLYDLTNIRINQVTFNLGLDDIPTHVSSLFKGKVLCFECKDKTTP